MKCPACKNPLREKNTSGVTLDTCYGGCGGIWFDAAELERVSTSAPAATTLHSIWAVPSANAQPTDERMCPRCPEQVLERKWFSDLKKVEIDRCPTCRGIWLDAEEFTRIYEEVKETRETSPLWLAAMEVITTHQEKPSTRAQPPGA
jgi:Zn-finger nucleic acid-binding protein